MFWSVAQDTRGGEGKGIGLGPLLGHPSPLQVMMEEYIPQGGNLAISNDVNSMDYCVHFVSSTIAVRPTIIQ